MDVDRDTLRARISRVIGWEQRKRREATLTAALLYALLGALAAPLFISLSRGLTWATPAVFFVLLAPFLLYVRRWRDPDTARAVAALDRTLHLDERATTAWELLGRNETRAVALLVLREASVRLKDVDARKLFPRAWGWRAWLLAPLVALWLGLNLFEARFQQGDGPGEPPALAREAREVARRLQEKARSEGLPRTLEAGRELEKLAQQAVEAKAGDDQFKNELAGFAGKMAAERKASPQAPFGAAESSRQLADLRAELEAARELVDAADSQSGSWEDRLAALGEVKKQLERQEGANRLSRDDMKAFLDKLDRRVAAELDRRALADTERSVKQLAQRGQSKQGDPRAGVGRDSDKDAPGEGGLERIPGSAAGNEVGKEAGSASLTESKSARGSQVKGTIGEGPRSGIFFKAKPVPGKSGLSREDVAASYRRQAEAELATESIPGELKDAIRSYFLSLDKAQ